VFINTHTHRQIYDAKIELVSFSAETTEEKPKLYSCGIHPWYINPDTLPAQLNRLRFDVFDKRCLAIGECGLDKLSKTDFELQQQAFMEQVQIANEAGKPLIIHCVKAFNELINCLRDTDNKVPVVIHGFNNNENIARVLKDEGFYLSFGKALLGFESNASKAIKTIGRKNFFLETDDADISIKYIYKKASELLGIDEEIIMAQLQSNFEKVFNFKL
jgi:TatD DNase family protein